MNLRLFDTHAHLNSSDFDDCVPEVVDRAVDAGVEGILVVGYDVASSRRAVELAAMHPGYLFACVGIQPNYTAKLQPHDWDVIMDLCAQPGVRAIGETGIDLYWNDAPLEVQRDYFDRHLHLSRDTGLPFVVHMRDSCPEIIEQLGPFAAQHGPLRGVMHSFTGTADQANACLAMGMHISFAGMVTFKKSDALRQVAATIPEDRLLIETDAPYLSPDPLRGKRPNEPARVQHTLQCLARERQTDPQRLAEVTTNNAKRFLQLP
ncbi:MAG: TatD family hydrolase [Planctomycetota bacterium]